MLNWFWKRRGPPDTPGARRRPEPGVRVAVDGEAVTLYRTGAETSRLKWTELTQVSIVTTDAGPFATDLFWHLNARDRSRSLVVPMGAAGEHDLLLAMQHRLNGFDNMAVIEAMSSTANATFTVWEAGPSR